MTLTTYRFPRPNFKIKQLQFEERLSNSFFLLFYNIKAEFERHKEEANNLLQQARDRIEVLEQKAQDLEQQKSEKEEKFKHVCLHFT